MSPLSVHDENDKQDELDKPYMWLRRHTYKPYRQSISYGAYNQKVTQYQNQFVEGMLIVITLVNHKDDDILI